MRMHWWQNQICSMVWVPIWVILSVRQIHNLEKGAITDNLPNSSVIRSGDYYYYIDAPNGDAATTVAGGTKDIGYKLEVNSGAYGAFAERYRNYGGATSDLQYVEYAVLAGNAGCRLLSRCTGTFHEPFQHQIY